MHRVCFVVYDIMVHGGVEAVTINVANALSELGYNVSIASIVNKKTVPISNRLHKTIPCRTMFTTEQTFKQMLINNFSTVKVFFREYPADIIFLMGIGALKPCFLLKRFVKSKVVYCDHGALANQCNDKSVTLLRFLSTLTTDAITTLTNRNRTDYMTYFRANPRKIFCIYNWIDAVPDSEIKPFHERKNWIISAGRFSPEKGLDNLLVVAEKVLARNPAWQWHVYGDGPLFNETEALVNKKELQNRLILKGHVDSLNNIYGEYSLFVLTSYREGLPLVLLEAKARGLPIVSFDVTTGPREIVEDGCNGDLIQPYDTNAMVDSICKLIDNSTLRQQYANNANKGLPAFFKDTILKQWVSLIDQLL